MSISLQDVGFSQLSQSLKGFHLYLCQNITIKSPEIVIWSFILYNQLEQNVNRRETVLYVTVACYYSKLL